jgi:hypothetical protein
MRLDLFSFKGYNLERADLRVSPRQNGPPFAEMMEASSFKGGRDEIQASSPPCSLAICSRGYYNINFKAI